MEKLDPLKKIENIQTGNHLDKNLFNINFLQVSERSWFSDIDQIINYCSYIGKFHACTVEELINCLKETQNQGYILYQP